MYIPSSESLSNKLGILFAAALFYSIYIYTINIIIIIYIYICVYI